MEVAQIVIDHVYAAQGKSQLSKYIDPNTLEEKKKRIDSIIEELRGEESSFDGDIVHGSAVGYGVKH